jgi:hypothetical protein
MLLLQITTLVALAAASASAAVMPSRRTTTPSTGLSLRARDLKSPKVWLLEVLAGVDKTFSKIEGKMEQAVKGIKSDILTKLKSSGVLTKAIKGMKHPEDLKTLQPKVDQVMKSLQPEFEKAAKDTRPREVVMKELKPKVDKAFSGLKPQLSKVWDDFKSGLYKAGEVADRLIEAPIAAIALFGFVLTHSLDGWELYTE